MNKARRTRIDELSVNLEDIRAAIEALRDNALMAAAE